MSSSSRRAAAGEGGGARSGPARSRRRRGRGRLRVVVRARRFRVALGLSVILLVAILTGWIYLQVAVTRVFDGPIWSRPSRIYSDVLELRAGDRMPLDLLVRRLERSGYARTDQRPGHPGQYRRRGSTLEVHARAFATGEAQGEARLLEVRVRDDRVSRVVDERGRAVRPAILEPELLATLYGPVQEERRLVPLEGVPRRLVDAVLAAEDARFFEHAGIDWRGVLRAAWANVRRGQLVQGGSTITQQTVKNLFLGQERTWWRKAREAAAAVVLDAGYPKERILEIYLNEVYLGQRGSVAICGVQAAARFYFGRDVRDLSLAECALLAGLISSPGRYNPFADPERAVARRNQVLEAMERLARIDAATAAVATREPLVLASGSGGFLDAPWVVDFVRSQIEAHAAGLRPEDGLDIHTSLDTTWQEVAESTLREGLDRLDHERRGKGAEGRHLQGAVLVTEPRSGAILAMVGGRDYRTSQFNRAVQARRQPGSCFKPFVYAAAFEAEARRSGSGVTPATRLDDEPIELISAGKSWRPANYDHTFRGAVTARQALEESLNVPTVRVAERVGAQAVVEVARRAGIESPLEPLPSLALGTEEVNALELATAYGTLANGGWRVAPWIIREIRSAEGESLWRMAPSVERGLAPETAFLVTDILRGVLERGTARSARELGWSGIAAGKTGTTDDMRDAWFVGYTPARLALVWVGYDDNARTGLTGARGALPIWSDLMRRSPVRDSTIAFAAPSGVTREWICPESGDLARDGCPRPTAEWFVRGSEPAAPCSLHRRGVRGWLDRLIRRDPSGSRPPI